MTQRNLNELSDQELLEEARKARSTALSSAFFIGLLIGIVVYSAAKNSWGFLTLILLFVIYKLMRDDKKKRVDELEKLLEERNLK